MGVPGFFGWLLRKYKNNNVILQYLKKDKKIDYLFIDANCLFHPQCFKILDKIPDWDNKTTIEDKMMKRIINYIDYLIDITNPKNVMISVDGVAPVGKMSQQRKRRFRSLDDKRLENSIKKKHGIPVGKLWSNIVITPGTTFMEKLHNKIIKYINTKKKIKIVYSSYHTPGEGEHKLLKYIKNATNDKKSKDNNFVVYGLDADLIFLSIASQKNNIFLLREANYIKNNNNDSLLNIKLDPIKDVEEELNYVSIDEMKKLFFLHFKERALGKIQNHEKYLINTLFCNDKLNDVMNDFVVVCYFLGNDFLPHIPSIDIGKNGLDMIIDGYIDAYIALKKNFIRTTPKLEFDLDFMNMFLGYISKREDYFFLNILPKHKKRNEGRRCQGTDEYEKEKWELKYMKRFKIDDKIKLGKGRPEDWKYRYYSHYFKTDHNQDKCVDNICKNYIDGLKWVLYYYFDECPSWTWCYPFIHAPFISDIYSYFKRHKESANSKEFVKGCALLPCEQLLAVLPPECNNILPKSYRQLVKSFDSPIIDLYPTNVTLDMIDKDQYWKCLPFIPNVNVKRIRSATQNLKLSQKETVRNCILGEILN